MRDDELSLTQKLVGNSYTFIEQTAGILAKIENKPLQIAHLIQRIRNFMLRGLVETSDVHIANARPNQEMQINAVARNFVANHRELERFIRAFAQDGDVNRGPFRSFKQISHVAGAHVVGGFAIHGDDNVARPDAGAIRWGSNKRRNHNDFIIARSNRHAHAVVFAALILAQQGIRLGVKKIRMRIEHVQHAGNCAVVNGLIGINRLGVILLHHIVDCGELAQAVAYIRITASRCRRGNLLPEEHPQKSANYENENNQEECATRTKDHLQFPSVLGIKKANYRPERSITCSKRSHWGVLDLSNHRD